MIASRNIGDNESIKTLPGLAIRLRARMKNSTINGYY